MHGFSILYLLILRATLTAAGLCAGSGEGELLHLRGLHQHPLLHPAVHLLAHRHQRAHLREAQHPGRPHQRRQVGPELYSIRQDSQEMYRLSRKLRVIHITYLLHFITHKRYLLFFVVPATNLCFPCPVAR